MKIDWNDQSDFPDEISKSKDHLSVDVLVYNKKTNEHTIGWFNFNVMTWNFLCRESMGKFKWRYFIDSIDKIKK